MCSKSVSFSKYKSNINRDLSSSSSSSSLSSTPSTMWNFEVDLRLHRWFKTNDALVSSQQDQDRVENTSILSHHSRPYRIIHRSRLFFVHFGSRRKDNGEFSLSDIWRLTRGSFIATKQWRSTPPKRTCLKKIKHDHFPVKNHVTQILRPNRRRIIVWIRIKLVRLSNR